MWLTKRKQLAKHVVWLAAGRLAARYGCCHHRMGTSNRILLAELLQRQDDRW